MPTLTLHEIELTYPATPPVAALRGISLQFDQGDFVVIDGPSGGGKSTLLNVLGLLDRPTAGAYTIDGKPAPLTELGLAKARSNLFSFVFQAFHLLDRRPVLDSVELGLAQRGVSRRERRTRALAALDSVGMAAEAHQLVHTLSGGQQQRVAIARALATGAPVLLADEPTGNLDTDNSAAVMRVLRSVQATGVTVIIVSHDPDIAAAADRRLRLVDGHLVSDVRQAAPPAAATASHASEPPGTASTISTWDQVRDAVSALLARPGRSIGLSLAVAAAVGLSAATTGLTASAAAQVSASFDARQNRFVTVTKAAEEPAGQPITVGWTRPDDQQTAAALAAIAGVDAAGTLTDQGSHDLTTAPGRGTQQATVYGATDDIGPATGTSVRWLDARGPHLRNGELLIGSQLAQRLEVGALRSSPVLTVDGRTMAIAGIITDSERLPDLTAAVLMTTTDADVLGPSTQTQYVLLTQTGAAQQVARQAPLAIDPVDPSALQVTAPTDPRDLRVQIESEVRTAMTVLTAVALLAATVALMNVMVLSVNERRAELALRQALGARRRQIAALILTEASATGAIGGLIGLLGGLTAVLAVTLARRWAPVVDLRLAPLAIAAGILLGAMGGIAAAGSAARVNPGRALRL